MQRVSIILCEYFKLPARQRWAGPNNIAHKYKKGRTMSVRPSMAAVMYCSAATCGRKVKLRRQTAAKQASRAHDAGSEQHKRRGLRRGSRSWTVELYEGEIFLAAACVQHGCVESEEATAIDDGVHEGNAVNGSAHRVRVDRDQITRGSLAGLRRECAEGIGQVEQTRACGIVELEAHVLQGDIITAARATVEDHADVTGACDPKGSERVKCILNAVRSGRCFLSTGDRRACAV